MKRKILRPCPEANRDGVEFRMTAIPAANKAVFMRARKPKWRRGHRPLQGLNRTNWVTPYRLNSAPKTIRNWPVAAQIRASSWGSDKTLKVKTADPRTKSQYPEYCQTFAAA